MLQVPPAALSGIVARPESFLTAYGGAGGSTYVRNQLGSAFASLTDAGCLAAFASAVAFNAAPAGTTTLDPTSATLHDLLTAEALAASHFCKLSTLLALIGAPGLVPPPAGMPPKATLHFLVWLDTVPLNTGAHTQLVFTSVLENAYLLLDPMYAYALRIPFVGSAPPSRLTLADNVATMLEVPIQPNNLALLDPAPTAAAPGILTALLSGALGPQYVNDDSHSSGSSFWDVRIAQIIDNLS